MQSLIVTVFACCNCNFGINTICRRALYVRYKFVCYIVLVIVLWCYRCLVMIMPWPNFTSKSAKFSALLMGLSTEKIPNISVLATTVTKTVTVVIIIISIILTLPWNPRHLARRLVWRGRGTAWHKSVTGGNLKFGVLFCESQYGFVLINLRRFLIPRHLWCCCSFMLHTAWTINSVE